MLKFKLKRIGRRGQPYYRVVVTQNTGNRSGKSVDDLGAYNPHTNPPTFDIDVEKTKVWLSRGVIPTDTISQYFVKMKLMSSPKKGSVPSKGRTNKKEAKTTA